MREREWCVCVYVCVDFHPIEGINLCSECCIMPESTKHVLKIVPCIVLLTCRSLCVYVHTYVCMCSSSHTHLQSCVCVCLLLVHLAHLLAPPPASALPLPLPRPSLCLPIGCTSEPHFRSYCQLEEEANTGGLHTRLDSFSEGRGWM